MAGKGVLLQGREVGGENVKNKEMRKRKKEKHQKCNFSSPYSQVLPLLLLLFELFSFQVAQKLCLLHVNPCHKLLYLFLFSSSHTAVWIMYISHALNPQNTYRPPRLFGMCVTIKICPNKFLHWCFFYCLTVLLSVFLFRL